MATVNYVTSKVSDAITSKSIYNAHAQHERIMSVKETYAFCEDKTGYKAAQIRAVMLAVREAIVDNLLRGNAARLDGVVLVRNTCKGAFAGITGPWVAGVNMIVAGGLELDPFKSTLADATAVNKTSGSAPRINTVLDEETLEYDVITGTDGFSIAGSDLAPDTSKDDEYVAFVDPKTGVEYKAEITYSDLGNVKAKLTAAIAAGEYNLTVYTRSGLGEDYGVRTASRKVTVA